MNERITKAQISKIWACAHALGLDKELLYLLVPRGSISSLTKAEASALIEHLAGTSPSVPERHTHMTPTQRAGPEAPSGGPSPEQLHFIHFLFGRLGWLQQPARMRGFLRRFFHVDTTEAIPTRKKAAAVIEALKAMCSRSRQHARN